MKTNILSWVSFIASPVAKGFGYFFSWWLVGPDQKNLDWPICAIDLISTFWGNLMA